MKMLPEVYLNSLNLEVDDLLLSTTVRDFILVNRGPTCYRKQVGAWI